MSRIRSIHPSQWTEEDFVACSAAARLLLLGLRNEADDQGAFEWRPLSLKLRILPADPIEIDPLLDELVRHRQIARYEAEGRPYGVVLDWRAQRPRRPSFLHPAPPAELRQMIDEIPDNVGNGSDNDGSAPDIVRPERRGEESESESGEESGEGEDACARVAAPTAAATRREVASRRLSDEPKQDFKNLELGLSAAVAAPSQRGSRQGKDIARERWMTRMHQEALATMPAAQFERFVVATCENPPPPWAQRELDRIDRAYRKREGLPPPGRRRPNPRQSEILLPVAGTAGQPPPATAPIAARRAS